MEAAPSMGGEKRNSQVLPLMLLDQRAIYAAYMPFIKDAGLFVRTDKTFQLGDEVFILLKLLDEPDKIMIQGKVVWITPLGAENKRPPGIGVQLTGANAKEVRNKIDTYLAGFTPPEEGSDTL